VSRALPDPALARAALADEPGAVDHLARAWLPHVHAWCHRLGGPRVDGQDAAHEALIAMCRNLKRAQSAEVFPSWLFGVCRRVVANHRRLAWFRRWAPSPAAEPAHPGWSPERTTEARQAADLVWKALDRLSAEQREVLVLCELEERSGPEAAELLGVPLGTVKSRLRLAREGFRKQIEASGQTVEIESIAAEVG
jgi:RNA polymerase sigma-70 factor, ECF subfamily